MAMEVIKRLRGILTRDLRQHNAATGMRIDEVGDVVDFVVDDDPKVVFR